jgi:hypothetical protein
MPGHHRAFLRHLESLHSLNPAAPDAHVLPSQGAVVPWHVVRHPLHERRVGGSLVQRRLVVDDFGDHAPRRPSTKTQAKTEAAAVQVEEANGTRVEAPAAADGPPHSMVKSLPSSPTPWYVHLPPLNHGRISPTKTQAKTEAAAVQVEEANGTRVEAPAAAAEVVGEDVRIGRGGVERVQRLEVAQEGAVVPWHVVRHPARTRPVPRHRSRPAAPVNQDSSQD